MGRMDRERPSRLTRTLLFLGAGLAAAPPFMIFVLSDEPLRALLTASLFFLTAAAFFVAGRELGRKDRRAKLLAVAGALAMASLGILAGFSLGPFTFPAAGICVLAAWAALLYRSGRWVRIAFGIYVVVGLLMVVGSIGRPTFLWSLAGVLIWPIWVLFLPTMSILSLYIAQAIAAVLAIAAYVPPRGMARPSGAPSLGARGVALALGAGLVLGAVAVGAFVALANARVDTSARFELSPLVLGLVVAGGVLLGLGIAILRLRPSVLGAVGSGLGAALLFFVFSSAPAVTCHANGTSQGTPLEWQLTSFGRGSGSSGSSGSSSGSGVGSDAPTRSEGRFQSHGRSATYVCEGARVVEFGEVR